MKPKEQAQIIADLFQDMDWKTMPIRMSDFGGSYWFTAYQPDNPILEKDRVAIRINPLDNCIEVYGSGPTIREAAMLVLREAGLGEWVRKR